MMMGLGQFTPVLLGKYNFLCFTALYFYPFHQSASLLAVVYDHPRNFRNHKKISISKVLEFEKALSITQCFFGFFQKRRLIRDKESINKRML